MGNKFYKKQIKDEDKDEEDNAPQIENVYPMTAKEDLKNRNYKMTLIENKFEYDIFCVTSFPCGNIILSRKESRIEIYDENFKSLQVIENASEDWIYRVGVIDNNNFATVSYNGQLRIFTQNGESKLFELNQIIQVFQGWMDNLIITKSKNIITNDWGGNVIKIYSLDGNNKYELSMQKKSRGNRILCAEDYELLITSTHNEINFYNLYTLKFLKKLKKVGTNDKYSLFRIDNDQIVACHSGINIISLKEKKVIKTNKSFCPNIGCNVKNKGIFICARERIICLFRSDKLVCIQILKAYKDTIYGIFCHQNDTIMCYSLRCNEFQIYKIEKEEKKEKNGINSI